MLGDNKVYKWLGNQIISCDFIIKNVSGWCGNHFVVGVRQGCECLHCVCVTSVVCMLKNDTAAFALYCEIIPVVYDTKYVMVFDERSLRITVCSVYLCSMICVKSVCECAIVWLYVSGS